MYYFQLRLNVFDSMVPSMKTEGELTITVSRNRNAPVFQNEINGVIVFNRLYNLPPGSFIGQALAIDADPNVSYKQFFFF